jgi:acetyl-CoA C-acetyltransferase
LPDIVWLPNAMQGPDAEDEAAPLLGLGETRYVGVDDARRDAFNVEGGAIAHGHPIGATGAVLTTRLFRSVRRDGIRRGLITLCIGGGQGIALAVEAG